MEQQQGDQWRNYTLDVMDDPVVIEGKSFDGEEARSKSLICGAC